MTTYLLPVLAFLATLLAIHKDFSSSDNKLGAIKITALVLALLILATTQFQTYYQKKEAVREKLALEEDFNKTREKIVKTAAETEERLKRSLQDTQEKLVVAQNELIRLTIGQEDARKNAIQTRKIQECRFKLSEVKKYATLWGLFNHGYSEHQYRIPYEHQVAEFRRRMNDKRFNQVSLEHKMIGAMGKYDGFKNVYKDPEQGFKEFYRVRESITKSGCNLNWDKSTASFECECSNTS